MTLQTSGSISLANIQTEFGGSNPISLSEYYAGGTYVPAGTTGTNGAVPSSGAISFSKFYGTSKTVITLSSPVYIDSIYAGFSQASAVYNLNSDGYVYTGTYTTTQSFTQFEQWCTPAGSASGYEAKVTMLTGSLTFGTVGSWVALSSSQYWRLTVGVDSYDAASFTVDIRKTGTTSVLASANVYLTADTTNF